jgi:hypothetical protein
MADPDDKTIYTDEGDPIEWLEKDVFNHLDITTLIFGGTNSGKTTIIEEILYLLKDHVPNVLVIAPKTSSEAYSKKLPSRCIKEDLTKEKIKKIWARQVYATQIYKIANDIKILETLFLMAPDRESIVILEAIKRKAASVVNAINSSNLDFGKKRAQTDAIEKLQRKKFTSIYKEAIKKNKAYIEKQDLEPRQKIALEYLDFNPRLALVIDDMSEKFQVWMRMFKKSEENPIESIFYKNRHNFLTLIIAAHDDKLIDSELRKNSRVTVYTSSQSLVTSLDRKSNGFTSKEKKKAMHYSTRVFSDEEEKGIKTHQKLCYIREGAKFKYTIASLYPDFVLGSSPLKDLISKMPTKEDNLSVNPLVKDMFKKEKNRFKY